jgi:hypothetical protein
MRGRRAGPSAHAEKRLISDAAVSMMQMLLRVFANPCPNQRSSQCCASERWSTREREAKTRAAFIRRSATVDRTSARRRRVVAQTRARSGQLT